MHAFDTSTGCFRCRCHNSTNAFGKGKFKHVGKKRCKNLLGGAGWKVIINGEVFASSAEAPQTTARCPTRRRAALSATPSTW